MATPDPATWTETLVALAQRYQTLTEPLVFALGFAESTVFVSIFVPSTALFLAIGGAHSAVGGVFWPVWVAGASGAILGDMISFALGRYFKNSITRMWPLNTNPRWVAYARLTVSRYGLAGVISGKFLGMARPFIPVIAGSMRMPWHRFFFASVVSSFLWAGVFLAPGYGITWYLKQDRAANAITTDNRHQRVPTSTNVASTLPPLPRATTTIKYRASFAAPR